MINKFYVDARCLQDPNYAYRGVGFHTKALLQHAKIFFNDAIELHGLLEPSLPELSEEHRDLFNHVQYSRGDLESFKDTIFIEPSPLTHNQGNYARFICKENVFTYAIIYDFIPFIKGGYYFPNIASRLQYLANLEWLKQYDLLFPISEYTATCAHSIANIPLFKQRITGVAVRDSFKPVKLTYDAKLLSSFNPYNYFIVVGGGDPRKNVEIVIKAHIRLLEQLSNGPGLIIVGKYNPTSYDIFRNSYLKKGVEKFIEFKSDLSDAQLSYLYSYSLANISPSSIEGFSIPVIEAMACKCPSIASRIDAHQELIADNSLLFNPNNEQELFALMQKIAMEPHFRTSIVDSQLSTASKFSSDKVAKRFWEPIIERQLSKQRLFEKKTTIRPSKPRIAFVTPYPPDASGVADYSAVCLQELSKYVEIDVFTDASQPISSPHIQNFYPITPLPYVSNKYDKVISVIGNSPFHAKIIKNLEKYGGSCIAHDHTLAQFYFYDVGIDKFCQIASKFSHRLITHQEAKELVQDLKKLECICFDEIIHARPLIVHSKIVQTNIKRLYGVEPLYLPFAVYNKFTDNELTPQSKYHARALLDIPQNRICLMAFGILHPTKCISECIHMIDFLQKWGIDAHLYFVGFCSQPFRTKLEKLINNLHLSEKVHIKSRVSATSYKQFLIAADYAIQLRNCFSLSGALVDCISAGLPTIANEYLATSMEAPESVVRVNDQPTPLCLAEKVYHSFKNNLHLERNLRSKNEYLAKHNFSYYCNELLKFLQISQ